MEIEGRVRGSHNLQELGRKVERGGFQDFWHYLQRKPLSDPNFREDPNHLSFLFRKLASIMVDLSCRQGLS